MRYFEKLSANMLDKADQEYAIAKRYEAEGHPRKAKEHKEMAAKKYEQAGKSGFSKESKCKEGKNKMRYFEKEAGTLSSKIRPLKYAVKGIGRVLVNKKYSLVDKKSIVKDMVTNNLVPILKNI